MSLLFGVSFVLLFVLPPFQAEAGFFSAIIGEEAHADATADSPDSSSTMSLPKANVSLDSILQGRNNSDASQKDSSNKGGKKDAKDSQDSKVDPNANVNIVFDSAILPATGPLGVSDGKDVTDSSTDQTSIYVVRKGDSVGQIADMFGVSVNTILAANDLKKGAKLKEGDVLFILPISGLEHTVTKGQTLQSIAKLYKVDVSDITTYNGLSEDSKLAIGDKIMIPGGDGMFDEGGDKPAANLGSSLAKDKNYYDLHPLQNLLGYFIDPVPTGHKTQGLHGPGHRGIDIGAPKGTPIYASAAGEVLIAHPGWSGGYGNMIIIQHPNGTKTLYAHMSKIGTSTGDQVAQGEIIGYVGSTGHSTGPHLHFEVFNAKNPGADWSWAQ